MGVGVKTSTCQSLGSPIRVRNESFHTITTNHNKNDTLQQSSPSQKYWIFNSIYNTDLLQHRSFIQWFIHHAMPFIDHITYSSRKSWNNFWHLSPTWSFTCFVTIVCSATSIIKNFVWQIALCRCLIVLAKIFPRFKVTWLRD